MGRGSQGWLGGEVQCHKDVVEFTGVVERIVVAITDQGEFVEGEAEGEQRLRCVENRCERHRVLQDTACGNPPPVCLNPPRRCRGLCGNPGNLLHGRRAGLCRCCL